MTRDELLQLIQSDTEVAAAIQRLAAIPSGLIAGTSLGQVPPGYKSVSAPTTYIQKD